MRHLGLFEGIGGFMLAAEWMGWDHVAWVEWDKKCQLVLKKNFPNVKGYGDIKEFNGTEYRGKVDIITGGFPCQPFSNAGKRKGKDDDRYLWPEMLRVIREVKPTFVVGENVAGLFTMENGKTLDDILSDLENEGYAIESFIIPACAVQMPIRRDRIWIVAISECRRLQKVDKKFIQNEEIYRKGSPINFSRDLPIKWEEYKPNSSDLRKGDGLPGGMDRIKQLGNAIVPQVAYELFKAIEQL